MGRTRSTPRPEDAPASVLEELVLGEPLNAVQLGGAATRLLKDPAFQHAMDKAYSRCFIEWQEAGSVEVREAAHARLSALKLVENELEVLVNSGILEGANASPDVY